MKNQAPLSRSIICVLISCLLTMPLGALALNAASGSKKGHQNSPKPPARFKEHRLIVLTDIGADPDDTESLVRLLTYSNVIDIRGIIAVTSTFQKRNVRPGYIMKVLDAYKVARPHLLENAPGYPAFATLAHRVSHGLPVYGMNGVGPGKNSPGSQLIVSELENSDPRPLWIAIWGGENTLAQALWEIRKTKSPAEAQRLYRKLRVYAISDQDNSGPWIRKNFPKIFYICSPGSFANATWLGMSAPFPGSNEEVVSNKWIAKNIQEGHGPLGAAYPDVAYLMEGDTPSFLSLIPNGLNDPEHPNYGGWGGRYEHYIPKFTEQNWHPMGQNIVRPEPETRALWTNAEDTFSYPMRRSIFAKHTEAVPVYTSAQVTIWRWRKAVQDDFAARMCWATHPYKDCNHPPIPELATPHEFTVTSGQRFYLDATGSHDPDGDSLSYYWFQYKEAGTYKGTINFKPFAQNLIRLPVTAPEVSSPVTVQFILEVTDKGTPPLTRYERVIVHVRPRPKS